VARRESAARHWLYRAMMAVLSAECTGSVRNPGTTSPRQSMLSETSTPGAEQGDEPVAHGFVLVLRAVLEDEIERAGHLVHEPRHLADHHADALRQPRALEVLPRGGRAGGSRSIVKSMPSGANALAR